MAKKLSLPTTDTIADKPYKPSASELEERRRWKAEDALRDIERVEGYKADKNLMKDVKKLASEKVKNLNKVCGK